MGCKTCFSDCGNNIISDKCVEYTGPDIPLLDICQGDKLSQLEAAIVEKILSFIDGTGITLEDLDLDSCPYLEALADDDKSLVGIIQILWDNQCSLKTAIDLLQKVPTVFDLKCLTGLPANPTTDQILQASLNVLCTIKTTVDAIPSTYVKQSDLNTLVTTIVNNINTSTSGTVYQYRSGMIPKVAYEYYGDLTNFSSSGIGIASLGFEKVYLCNGQNGTPDKRGRVAVGAVRNVPGGSLDPAVDPAIPANLNTNYAVGEKFGKSYHILGVPEIPSHSHLVNDSGHGHNYTVPNTDGGRCSGGDCDKPSGTDETKITQVSLTGITIASTGGNQPHENRQPSIAAYYIMYIP